MDKGIGSTLQTIEYPTLKNQKRYFSTKRANIKIESKSRRPTPSSHSKAYDDNLSLMRGF